jgi:hypothetical protein
MAVELAFGYAVQRSAGFASYNDGIIQHCKSFYHLTLSMSQYNTQFELI